MRRPTDSIDTSFYPRSNGTPMRPTDFPDVNEPVIEYEIDHYLLQAVVAMRLNGRKVDEIAVEPIKLFELPPHRVEEIDQKAVQHVAKKYGPEGKQKG